MHAYRVTIQRAMRARLWDAGRLIANGEDLFSQNGGVIFHSRFSAQVR